MSKQQTAVEWLIEELVKIDRKLDGKRKSEDATVLKMNPFKIIEQAKEMEKQQIIDACVNFGNLNGVGIEDFEQYYNETFKKD
jgi:hypothetical protein